MAGDEGRPTASPAAGMAPVVSELPLMRDKLYAMHGQLMMLTLVALFSLFLVFLFTLSCIKRLARKWSRNQQEYPEYSPEEEQRYSFLFLRKRKSMEDDARDRQESLDQLKTKNNKNTVSTKFPLQ